MYRGALALLLTSKFIRAESARELYPAAAAESKTLYQEYERAVNHSMATFYDDTTSKADVEVARSVRQKLYAACCSINDVVNLFWSDECCRDM